MSINERNYFFANSSFRLASMQMKIYEYILSRSSTAFYVHIMQNANLFIEVIINIFENEILQILKKELFLITLLMTS